MKPFIVERQRKRHMHWQNTKSTTLSAWTIFIGVLLSSCQQASPNEYRDYESVVRGSWRIWKHKRGEKKSSSSSSAAVEEIQTRAVDCESEPTHIDCVTASPTQLPTLSPTLKPSTSSTVPPSTAPSAKASSGPSSSPSILLSSGPSGKPTASPSESPSELPSKPPSEMPSRKPSSQPSEKPTLFPTLSPTDQCQVSTFTVPVEGDETITVSFTSVIDLEVDCSTDYDDESTIELALLSYQNDLLASYGCSDEMQYLAGDISSICPISKEAMNEDEECIDIQAICGQQRRRGLQDSSVNRATIRYTYNSMGNCRRRCAEQSMPKESDVIGGGGSGGKDGGRRMMRLLGQDGSDNDTEDRSLLVAKLNGAGIKTYGASVKGDSQNDCLPGSKDCCEDDKCCGITKGCNCPSVSETYCVMADCDLPGCCGESPAWLAAGGVVPSTFNACPHDHEACQCSMMFLCESEISNCYKFSVCSENVGICR